MFCLWGRAFINSFWREKPVCATSQSQPFEEIPIRSRILQKTTGIFCLLWYCLHSWRISGLSSWGFLTFKIWTYFVYFLEANIPLWFILDVTYFLQFQALVWWLAGDCSVPLKIHEVSLVFFSACWKNFYSFLRRKEYSKWRAMSKRNTQIKPWKQPKVNINILLR